MVVRPVHHRRHAAGEEGENHEINRLSMSSTAIPARLHCPKTRNNSAPRSPEQRRKVPATSSRGGARRASAGATRAHAASSCGGRSEAPRMLPGAASGGRRSASPPPPPPQPTSPRWPCELSSFSLPHTAAATSAAAAAAAASPWEGYGPLRVRRTCGEWCPDRPICGQRSRLRLAIRLHESDPAYKRLQSTLPPLTRARFF